MTVTVAAPTDALLAWSVGEPPEVVEHIPDARPCWLRAWLRVAGAAVAVGSGVGAAAVLLLAPAVAVGPVAAATAHVEGESPRPRPVAAAFVMPASLPLAGLQTADGEYLTLLRRGGIDISRVPRASVFGNAHLACRDLARMGVTPAQLAAAIAPQFKKLTLSQVNSFVASAARAYCPQLGGS